MRIPHANWRLQVSSGEETSGTGAQHAIEKGFAPDYAIVGEGSTNYSGPDVTDIVAAHRGRQERTITAHGISSHASEPEVGENAIYRAYDAIEVLRGLDVPSIELYSEELLASATVTQITGGTTSNVIPDTCDLTVDERTIPGKDIQLDQVKEIENIDLTVENKFPPMQCDDDAFAETVLGAAVDVQENKPQIVTKPHATDAGWLADAGTTFVVCGGSEPGESHTKTESVNLDVLDRCYRIYRSVAERL